MLAIGRRVTTHHRRMLCHGARFRVTHLDRSRDVSSISTRMGRVDCSSLALDMYWAPRRGIDVVELGCCGQRRHGSGGPHRDPTRRTATTAGRGQDGVAPLGVVGRKTLAASAAKRAKAAPAGARHHRTATTRTRRTHNRAIASHPTWHEILVRSLAPSHLDNNLMERLSRFSLTSIKVAGANLPERVCM
jgi:hypothetical protein